MAVVVGEIASKCDPRPYKPEVVRRHDARVDSFRHAILAGQRYGESEDASEALEFVLRPFAKIDKICVGKGKVLDAAIAHIGGNNDELIGVLVRKRTQQHGIGDAEDGGAGADAQGDGYRGGEREDRTFPKCSASE